MIHDRKSQNIHANWPPFYFKVLSNKYIYIYGKGFCPVTSSIGHARVRIHVQNWTCVHISACPMKLATGHKPNPIYIT